MDKHCDPKKEPFKIGQLLKDYNKFDLGFSIVLDIKWDSKVNNWFVLVYHQHEGEKVWDFSKFFLPAGETDD